MTDKLGIYRHFKGNLYELFAIGKNSENPEELMAIYRSVSDPKNVWVRPLSMWDEEVTAPDGTKTPRFKRIDG